MQKILMVILFTSSICTTVSTWAGKDDHIIIQEAASNQVKVAEVKHLKDETAVTLKGTLVKHLNEDHYEFSDGTGLILLEIDDDLWKSAVFRWVTRSLPLVRWINIVINQPILKWLK